MKEPGLVVVFTGESGRDLWLRRARHLGRALGLTSAEVDQLPIRVLDEVAPVTDRRFTGALDRELRNSPALVVLDPLYTYYPSERSGNAGNVYDAGELLAALSGRTSAAGAALMIVNHFNKAAGKELTLSSITQAGSREWSESWLLLRHRRDALPTAGSFALEAKLGSRHGYGDSYDIDVELGRFDMDTLTHDGDPSILVTVRGSGGASAYPPGVNGAVVDGIVQWLRANVADPVPRSTIERATNLSLPGSKSSRTAAVNYLLNTGMASLRTQPGTDSRGRPTRPRQVVVLLDILSQES